MNLVKYVFSYEFLFYINRIRLEKVDYIFALVGAVFILLAVIFKIVSYFKNNPIVKQFLLKFVRLFSTIGLVSVLWYGARYEAVTFFGSHFVFLLICLIGIIWFAFLVKYWMGNYRVNKQMWEKEQVKQKYLGK